VACAAALAVLDVIAEERLLERAQQLGTKLSARLKSLQAKYSAIGEVRGLGSMVAIELVKNGSAEQPDADLTRALVQAAAGHGLIILSCGVHGNVIRFLAPLTISDALLGEGVDRLDAALGEVTAVPVVATA
jgi:4-aminobutyrate aminotransferase/(S)-3-amino-2-methylpropionate transaminase